MCSFSKGVYFYIVFNLFWFFFFLWFSQWDLSSASKLALMNVQQDASGQYACMVTLESPIYSKTSEYRDLTVIRKPAHSDFVTVMTKTGIDYILFFYFDRSIQTNDEFVFFFHSPKRYFAALPNLHGASHKL